MKKEDYLKLGSDYYNKNKSIVLGSSLATGLFVLTSASFVASGLIGGGLYLYLENRIK